MKGARAAAQRQRAHAGRTKRAREPLLEEIEVMQLVASGLKDDSVARCLGVSVITVRRRIRQFRERVGAESRVEAAVIGVRRGWL